jgi:hypothetical protein
MVESVLVDSPTLSDCVVSFGMDTSILKISEVSFGASVVVANSVVVSVPLLLDAVPLLLESCVELTV